MAKLVMIINVSSAIRGLLRKLWPDMAHVFVEWIYIIERLLVRRS